MYEYIGGKFTITSDASEISDGTRPNGFKKS